MRSTLAMKQLGLMLLVLAGCGEQVPRKLGSGTFDAVGSACLGSTLEVDQDGLVALLRDSSGGSVKLTLAARAESNWARQFCGNDVGEVPVETFDVSPSSLVISVFSFGTSTQVSLENASLQALCDEDHVAIYGTVLGLMRPCNFIRAAR